MSKAGKSQVRPATRPAFIVTGRMQVAIRKGTSFAGRAFAKQTALTAPEGGYQPGCDYGVFISGKKLCVEKLDTFPARSKTLFGGFHVAPGGNATARAGGDAVPAINPCSLWDARHRPACRDPRGMVFVDAACVTPFWCDIYLLNADHLANGTARFAVAIADGDNPPADPKGGMFRRLDYAVAAAAMKHHGKVLLSYDDFRAAAYGVTEKSVHNGDPETTQCDAARTSRFGLMQATGNLWVWGHDGDPEDPRPSLFGGAWFLGSVAGSRFAYLDYWPGPSAGHLGARGRSDHLRPESAPRQRRRAGHRA
jgi:hypothetical protein